MNAKVLIGLIVAAVALAQGYAQEVKGSGEWQRSSPLRKPGSIYHRGGGVHNRSNIGIWFENRGKLYPRRANPATPSGEFPLRSGMEYLYRINPFVGIPGNVIQGRWTTDEEWEAAAGYLNIDSAQIAFSDKPFTWPSTGWPVKDAAGNPVFVSDQDSYCVYNDSNNTKGVLNIQINQTGYAFGLPQFQNMIFFTYQIVNRSNRTYDSLYFALYCDIDVGDVSGGVPEYADDKMGFDKQLGLAYFYDDGFTTEWPGGRTGFFGATMIKTPMIGGVEAGITDLHYNIYDDDFDIDTLQYGILSSAASLYASKYGPKYFHPGANAPNLHFDDPATIPASGLDILANLSSGPYSISPGDTLTFVTAIVAGWTRDEIFQSARSARDLFQLGYRTPRPPEPPKVSVVPGDKRVTIYWDNRSESSRDPFTGSYDFQGYRLYKSIDRAQHWDQVDRNLFPATGANPVPLAQFDKIDGIGADKGLQYTYIDTAVVNGFEYWYTVTAYDASDDATVSSLESALGKNKGETNLGVGFPRSDAIGRLPVEADSTVQSGAGQSNVVWATQPGDVPEAGDKTYEIIIDPVVSIARGNLRSLMQVTLDTVTDRTSDIFSLVFLSSTQYRVYDLTRGRTQIPSGAYVSGTPITFLGVRLILTDTAAAADVRPEKGDSLVIRPGLRATASGVEVLSLRPLEYGTKYSTTNGVVILASIPYPVRSIVQTAGMNQVKVVEELTDPVNIPDQLYSLVFDSVWVKNQVTYANVTLKDSLGRKIAGSSSVQSGDNIEGVGFTLTWSWDIEAPPSKGTTIQVRTVKQRPATYLDKISFTTHGAKVDQQKVASELGRVKVVPNPYVISSLYEEEFLVFRREPIRQLKFTNLPPQCTITIFTLDGDQVKTIEHSSGDGSETWNMKGDGGREIASGIYIYLVKTETAERIDRFAVIK